MTAVLHVLAGPNGAGKSTLAERVLLPVLHLPFVNADRIAAEIWPAEAEARAYDAARLAEARRRALLDARRSFVTETVFSHASKTELVRDASRLGYRVHLHVILVPLELSLRRVPERAAHGGHSVPPEKIRERYERLWAHVDDARAIADVTTVYDNSTARTPFKPVARYTQGELDWSHDWPGWSPLAR